jgi:hypothetical protein
MIQHRPRWISYGNWGCANHIPMAKIPSTVTSCWYCGTDRPAIDLRPAAPPRAYGQPRDQVLPEMSGGLCAWEGCKNPTTTQSKYCSRKCSNNNARARAAARKEQSPENAAPLAESAE